jgi:hypothetical protein
MFALGTPATTSQLAKDVVTFLNWTAEPEHDVRKQYGIKAVILFSALTAISLYIKRFKWTVLKSRKISQYTPRSPAGIALTVTQCTTRRGTRATSTEWGGAVRVDACHRRFGMCSVVVLVDPAILPAYYPRRSVRRKHHIPP